MASRKIIISGATGLIGSALVEALAPDWEVHGISRKAGPNRAVNWHELDLSSPADFGNMPRAPGAFVYLAQSEFFREFPQHSCDVFQVNTFNLLKALDYARVSGCRMFVFASSGGVYGSGTGAELMSEEIPIPAHRGLGFYLSTKLCSEIIAQNYAPYFNLVILRYFFVYGPGQRQSMLIPRLIRRVREGQPILLVGEEGTQVNPIHVSDAVAATKRALDLSGSHTVNVGGPEVLSLREIGRLIGEAVGREPTYTVDTSVSPGNLVGDITRMRELLVEPDVRFSEGVKTLL